MAWPDASEKRKRLANDLKQLRRGPGLTVQAVADLPRLVTALRAGDPSGATAVILTEAVKLADDGSRSGRALANALATDSDGKGSPLSLEQRRRDLIPDDFGSERTLIRAEDSAFNRLADAMMDKVYWHAYESEPEFRRVIASSFQKEPDRWRAQIRGLIEANARLQTELMDANARIEELENILEELTKNSQ